MKTQNHISHEYDEELENLHAKALQMGSLVKEQFKGATKSLLKGKTKLAQHIAHEDYKVNALEVSLDEDCSRLIARRQPKAIDLRNIFAMLKIVTDLERIGDESERIANFASELSNDAKSMIFFNSLKALVVSARGILSAALDCYERLDADKALEVAQLDSGIDIEFMNLNRTLTTYLLEDINNIEDTIKVMWCARSIERVGDHAKNICEYVVYVVHGNDIRNITEDEAPQK